MRCGTGSRYARDTVEFVSLRQVLGVIVVAICVAAPIAEAFDQWDHTLQDGNDTEANLVVAAVCVGVALSVAATIIARVRALATAGRIRVRVSPATRPTQAPLFAPKPSSGPPTPLRI